MDLARELHEGIRTYLAGRSSIEDLHMWLLDHAQEVADAFGSDASLRRLAGRAWLVISELDAGHTTEGAARRELADVLPFVPVYIAGSGAPMPTQLRIAIEPLERVQQVILLSGGGNADIALSPDWGLLTSYVGRATAASVAAVSGNVSRVIEWLPRPRLPRQRLAPHFQAEVVPLTSTA